MRIVAVVLFFSLLFSGGAAGGYYYYYLIPEKVERKLLESIHALGFEAFSFDAVSKEREKITLRNVVLDKDGFSTVDEISIYFSLSQIFKSDQARRLHIKGIKLTASFDADKNTLSFDGFGSATDFLNNFKQIPARSIVIEDGRIDVMTDVFGGISLDYNAQFDRQNDAGFNIIGRVSTKQNKLSFHSKFTGQLSSAYSYNFNAELEQLSLTHPEFRVRRGLAKIANRSESFAEYDVNVQFSSLVWNDFPLSNVTGSVRFKPNSYIADLRGVTFGEKQVPWSSAITYADDVYKTKTSLTPKTLSDALAFFTNSKDITLANPLPTLIVGLSQPDIQLDYDYGDALSTGNLKITFSDQASDLNFKIEHSQDDDLYTGRLEKTELTLPHNNPSLTLPIELDGAFSLKHFWGEPGFDLNLLATVKDGSLDLGVFKLEGVSGLIPYGVQKKRKDIEILDFSLPLKDDVKHTGKLATTLYADNGFEIVRAVLSIYGGSIKADRILFSDSSLQNDNTITVADLDLGALFEDLGFEDVFASGTFGGIIPVKLDVNSLKANGAILQSQGSGVIRIPSDTALSLFPGESERMKQIRASLKNFYYEFFEIRFDGDLNGRVLMTIKASGLNPELKDKAPVDLNLQIETKISTVLKRLLK